MPSWKNIIPSGNFSKSIQPKYDHTFTPNLQEINKTKEHVKLHHMDVPIKSYHMDNCPRRKPWFLQQINYKRKEKDREEHINVKRLKDI